MACYPQIHQYAVLVAYSEWCQIMVSKGEEFSLGPKVQPQSFRALWRRDFIKVKG